jgi:tetratricopeptide (TPR) repeat protein
MARYAYKSDNLLVRVVHGADTRHWVVTFDHYDSGPISDERSGFAEEFFSKRGVSLVTLISRGNDWYQYVDLLAALEAAKGALSGAERIMTYGTSMGAYAAIRFADVLGANACVAISPQYSNDPRKVPFEWRWADDAKRIRWRSEIDGTIQCSFKPVVMSESAREDGKHVQLIAADTPIEFIRLPFVGHPVSTYLGEIGMLEEALMSNLRGQFDPATFRQQVYQPRKNNPTYLCQLARHQPRWRPRLSLTLAEHAVSRAPSHPLAIHVLANALTTQARHAEALPLHAQVYEMTNRLRGYGLPYIDALIAVGDWQGALEVSRDLVDRSPGFADHHSRLGKVLYQLGQIEEALAQAKIARTIAPTNRHYRVVVLRYERRARIHRFSRLVQKLRSFTRHD